MIQVIAPADLLANRNKTDILRGRHLVARMQYRFRTGVLHVNFAFNYGDARALRARVYGKDRASYGHSAIRSADIQVSGLTMRGLHDDAALVEVNSGVATVRADREFSALVHLHFGTVEEPHNGVGICRRADQLALGDFVAGF